MRTVGDKITLIGYASGVGAGNSDCSQGPLILQASPFLKAIENKLSWQEFLAPPELSPQGLQALPIISELSTKLAQKTAELVAKDQFFITLGGDHTCAIGTWSGVSTAISPLSLGLIWIDAHLDSHIMETTPSSNIHGMALAALLGFGDAALTHILTSSPKILPENICIIGPRSYEPEEKKLLEQLKVRIFYKEEIEQRGFTEVFAEAITNISQKAQFFGVSLDVDVISPEEAPGVGTSEPDGITANAVYQGINQIVSNPNFIGAEIAEFNPHKDIEQKTEKIIANIIEQLVKGLK